MLSDSTPFTLDAGELPAGHLRVLSFRGRETVSRPFRFDVTVAVRDEGAADLEAACLGAPATLALQLDGNDMRRICGIVASVEALAAFEQGRRAFRLRLVPRLWLLGKRKTSRIFQDKTVPQIVDAVLDAAGVLRRWTLVEKYPARVYCVQYQETDLAFVARLLAEEGIFYTFEHGSAETVVFSDSAHLYEPIPGNPKLAYRYEQGSDGLAPEEHHIGRFAVRRAIKPGAVLQRGYDFCRPRVDLRADTRTSTAPSHTMAPADEVPFEVRLLAYDHDDDDERPHVDSSSARVRLEQHRRRAIVAEGASACRRLSPGLRFELVDHELDTLNRSYVLARVEHDGRAPAVARGHKLYTNTFTCVPANVPLRPKRRARAIQQVAETAVVVGPPGEEIHTDEHGRVKVQFRWDLDGKHDEQSSCWLRVSQAWAGGGWGFQFIPRIGMEVVVTFLGGDTDRPLITGCVYNGANASPFALPGSKTRSGIVTRSTPRGTRGNELSFEDGRGKEEIVVRAERDLIESVGRDRDQNIGRDRRESVARHAIDRVRGDMMVDVGGALQQSVRGDHATRCDGDASQMIRGRASLNVEGSTSIAVEEDYTLHVAGSADVVVGTPGKGHHHGLMVHGDHVIGATDSITLRAENTITLQCGASILELGRDGVKLAGKRLDFSGREGVSMKGPGPSVRLEDEAQIMAKTLRIFSSDASLVLDEDAKLKGKRVLLNCDEEKPISTKADDRPVETKPFKLKISDAEFGCYANKTFHLLVDGATYEGKTDGEGVLEKQIPKDAKSLTIVVWTGEYPTSEQKTWTIQVGEMPAASTPRGALMRLANLGYYGGEAKDELDEAAKKAVRDFQAHAGLPDTGELDAATAGKLNAMHGK